MVDICTASMLGDNAVYPDNSPFAFQFVIAQNKIEAVVEYKDMFTARYLEACHCSAAKVKVVGAEKLCLAGIYFTKAFRAKKQYRYKADKLFTHIFQ